ncbi:hypothetical protein ACBI99_31815 [Nonomuraea sp. ATR24]|uniref:hypothetical protein n=1 Tax=unclassified Nonomuraea TaxID=2593643 RepID=UPI0033E1D459
MRGTFEAALVHVVGGINWMIFQITRGHLVLHRFRGVSSLNLTMIESRTSESYSMAISYLADGADYVVLADRDSARRASEIVKLANADIEDSIHIDVFGRFVKVGVLKIGKGDCDGLLVRLLKTVSLSERYEVRRQKQIPLLRLTENDPAERLRENG